MLLFVAFESESANYLNCARSYLWESLKNDTLPFLKQNLKSLGTIIVTRGSKSIFTKINIDSLTIKSNNDKNNVTKTTNGRTEGRN